jgi:hypothetical protein
MKKNKKQPLEVPPIETGVRTIFGPNVERC